MYGAEADKAGSKVRVKSSSVINSRSIIKKYGTFSVKLIDSTRAKERATELKKKEEEEQASTNIKLKEQAKKNLENKKWVQHTIQEFEEYKFVKRVDYVPKCVLPSEIMQTIKHFKNTSI